MRFILGSQSKWRADIFKRMGYEFEVMAADIDEKVIRFKDPRQLALVLANAKADALLPKIKGEAILITSDQVDVCNGEIREKPDTGDRAREFLRSYNKYPVETVTAVVAVNTANKKRKEGIDVVRVHFRPLLEDKISKLIASGCVFSCAGGFCINDPVFKDCIERVEGEVDSVAGLPKALTEKLIQEVK